LTSEIISDVLKLGEECLLENEAKLLCQKYGLKIPKSRFARSLDEALEAAREIGYPVILKVISRDILHKTDVDGVILGVKNDEELKTSYNKLLDNVKSKTPNARIEGVLVEEELPKPLVEIAIGGVRDDAFGPLIMFGLGGIFIEVLKDVTFRIAPITYDDAIEMIKEIKGYKILTGARGFSVNIELLANTLINVSRLLIENPEINQLDLNPIFAYKDNFVVVDSKIILSRKLPIEYKVSIPTPEQVYNELKPMFYPESIAVIGASSKKGKLGYRLLSNIISFGYKGKVYPVNPKESEILGLKVYKSVLDIPDKIDLAIILIPADKVPEALEECGRKGIKNAIIEAGGFAEMGIDRARLQKEIGEISRKYGIKVLGPNCAGFINAHINLVTSFAELNAPVEKGSISIIAQAGIFAAGMLELYPWGIDKIITIGNKEVFDEVDALLYLAAEDKTKVIGLYIEGTRNGRRLLEALKTVSRRKPVIVMKGGRTSVGGKLTMSHTASLAGEYSAWRAAFKQGGAIEVHSLDEFLDLLKYFSMQGPMRGNRVGIITYSGSMGIIAADTATDLGLEVPKYDDQTLKELSKVAFPWTSTFNPLDLSFLVEPWHYYESIRILLDRKVVDGVMCVVPALRVVKIAEEVSQLIGKYEEPIIFSVPMMDKVFNSIQTVEDMGIPCYPTPDRAIRILAKSYKYSKWLEKHG